MTEEKQQDRDQRNREQWSYERRRQGTRGGIIIGLVLISIGVILLVGNFFPALGFGDLWPVIIIAWGFAVFATSFVPPFKWSQLFQGVLLGTVGLILLYNTLGIIAFSFWLDLISLWPVLLIAVGLSILGGVIRSRFVSALAPISVVLSLILALAFQDVIFKDRNVTGFEFSRAPISGVTSGSASIDFGIGEIDIGATDKLYDIDARELGGRRGPRVRFDRSGSEVELKIEPRRGDFIPFRNRDRKWKVFLSRDIDWKLDIKTGVSDSELDLSDLKVSELNLDGGIGDVAVRLGDKVEASSVDIDAGISQLKLLVPKSVGVRASIEQGLSVSEFSNIDLRRINDADDDETVYETPEFNRAARQLTINVDAGISSFTIEGY